MSDPVRESEIDDLDGWCEACGDAFHLDDTGGYNPPCSCGCGLCRSCHNADEMAEDEWQDEPGVPSAGETPQ